MSQLERLVGMKALLDAAIEEELAKTDPPTPTRVPVTAGAKECEHPNREEVSGAGTTTHKWACPDCGLSWEAD